MRVCITITDLDHQWALKYFIPAYLKSMGIEYTEDARDTLIIRDEKGASALIISGLPDYIAQFTSVTIEEE